MNICTLKTVSPLNANLQLYFPDALAPLHCFMHLCRGCLGSPMFEHSSLHWPACKTLLSLCLHEAIYCMSDCNNIRKHRLCSKTLASSHLQCSPYRFSSCMNPRSQLHFCDRHILHDGEWVKNSHRHLKGDTVEDWNCTSVVEL